MWHASAMAKPGIPADSSFLRGAALDALDGVGDSSLGEWDEWTGKAYHIRRRLAPWEERRVGEVKDIRGTPEAALRLAPVADRLPYGWRE